MKVPTIHLNGTSADELFRQVRQAGTALRHALEALYEMAPNARDYYVQGDGAFEEARKEHGLRLDALIGVQEQLTQMGAKILDQRDARKVRT